MNQMNESRLRALGFGFFEQIKVMNDMNNSGLWVKGFKCNE